MGVHTGGIGPILKVFGSKLRNIFIEATLLNKQFYWFVGPFLLMIKKKIEHLLSGLIVLSTVAI